MTETIKPFYNQNGYTEFNNYVLDHIMPKLSPNEWKVLCFIIRKTKGWQKDLDQLSFSQIMTGTGIKNRNTVSSAISKLEDNNYINVLHSSDGITSNTYSLNTDLEIQTGSTEIVLPTTTGSTKNVPGVVQKSYTQKKGLKKGITIITTPAQELSIYFSSKTDKHPKGAIDSQCWDDDSQVILDKAGGDVETAKGYIDESLAILAELGYARKTPASLHNTIDNMLKQKERKNGAQQNGQSKSKRANGNGNGKANGTGAKLSAEPYYDPATNENVYPDGRREYAGV